MITSVDHALSDSVDGETILGAYTGHSTMVRFISCYFVLFLGLRDDDFIGCTSSFVGIPIRPTSCRLLGDDVLWGA